MAASALQTTANAVKNIGNIFARLLDFFFPSLLSITIIIAFDSLPMCMKYDDRDPTGGCGNTCHCPNEQSCTSGAAKEQCIWTEQGCQRLVNAAVCGAYFFFLLLFLLSSRGHCSCSSIVSFPHLEKSKQRLAVAFMLFVRPPSWRVWMDLQLPE